MLGTSIWPESILSHRADFWVSRLLAYRFRQVEELKKNKRRNTRHSKDFGALTQISNTDCSGNFPWFFGGRTRVSDGALRWDFGLSDLKTISGEGSLVIYRGIRQDSKLGLFNR